MKRICKRILALALAFALTFSGTLGVSAATATDSAETASESRSDGTTTTTDSDWTLEEDTVITGDLSINGGILDLAGYTLTVYGSVYLTEGTICMNGGTFNIEGDFRAVKETVTGGKTVYEYASAELDMCDSEDVLNVSGDIIWYTYDYITNGTIYLAGDLIDYDGFDLGYDTQLVLTGTGTQTLTCESEGVYFANLEVQNADSRDINWSGYFRVGTLLSDISIVPENLTISYLNDINGMTVNIAGDVAITGYIYVNYGTLRVEGTVTHTGGQLSLNYGTVVFCGDYLAWTKTTNSAGTTYYGSVSAELTFNNTDSGLFVAGDFCWYGYGFVLYSGTVTVTGDFYSLGTDNLCFYGDSRLVLNGTGTQSVKVEPTYTYFSYLEVENADSREINWSGYFGVGSLDSDITINPDGIEIVDLDTNGHTMTVQGDAAIWNSDVEASCGDLNIEGDVTLSGGTLHAYYANINISGSLTQTAGTLYAESGTVNIGGDYLVATVRTTSSGVTVYGEVDAGFNMNGTDAAVNVGGDFCWYGNWFTVYTGVLTVAGDFSSLGSNNACFYDDSSLVLNGTGTQAVTVEPTYTYFEKLIVENADSRDISWSGYFGVGTLESDISIIPDDIQILDLDTNGHTMTVQGDAAIWNSDVEASCGDLNIEGDVTLSGGMLRAYYANVNISGNMTQTAGNVYVDNGSLNVSGNLTHTDGTIEVHNSGSVNVGGDYDTRIATTSSSGTVIYEQSGAYIYMVDEDTVFCVDGDFVFYGYDIYFFGATLKVGGDLVNMDRSFYLRDGGTLVLTGTGTQTITADPYDTYFDNLEVENADSRTIIWTGYLRVGTLLTDINIETDGLILNYLNANAKTITIDGDVTMTGDVSADYGMIRITGSVTHTDGQLNLDNGTVEIGGDYVAQSETTNTSGSTVYERVNATLYMDHVYDSMIVGGDFIWYGSYNSLTQGTLTIGGNFEDKNTDSWYMISASDDHVTVLNGEGSKTVTFANSEAHFNTLKLTNAKSLYTFSFEPCWNLIEYEYEREYTVSFDPNYAGAEEIEDQSVLNGTTATAPVLSREGYSYIWCLLGTTTEYDFDTPVNADLELYALWTRNSYTVTFDTAGGTANDDVSQTVKYHSTVSEPSDPTREGYRFLGWYEESAKESYSFDTPVTGDLVLTAKWESIVLTVTYDANGGTFTSDGEATDAITQDVTYGAAAEQPQDPEREGYVFEGWYVPGSTTAYDFDTAVTSDVELCAKWTRSILLVTFEANGGTLTDDSVQKVKYYATVSVPSNPTREGYIFTGWYLADSEEAYDFDTQVTENLVLVAQWEVKAYEVSFDANRGQFEDGTSSATCSVNYGETVVEPAAPTKTGYTFDGWYVTGTQKAYDFEAAVTGNVELYAKWSLASYTVTFDANGGTLASNSAAGQTVKHGALVSEPMNPTYTGYDFAGWFTGLGEDADEYDFTQVVIADITLYAHWTTKNWTVSFNANYSGAEEIASLTVANGEVVEELAAMIRVGYTYIWCEYGTTTAYDFDTPVTGNLELYAKWTRTSHTVTFDANGGEFTGSAAVSVKHNATVAQPDDPTLEDHTFDGWFTADGTLFDFDATLITEDITLYAQWTECEKPIVITSQPTDTEFVSGEKVTFTITAEGKGLSYTWYYQKAGTTTWKSWPQNTNALSVTANSTWEGMQVYCIVTDEYGKTMQSDTITLTESTGEDTNAITITAQPVDVQAVAGEKATFIVVAEGNDLSYTWYYQKSGSSTWGSWPQDTNTLSVTANSTWDGMQVYCLITDGDGNTLKSDVITITLKTEDEEQTDAITITVQPEDMTVTAGTKVTFTVTAEGNDLSYKWYHKKAGATEYSSWSQNTNALRVTANSTWEGMQVYCEITDADGNVVRTNVITLTVAE